MGLGAAGILGRLFRFQAANGAVGLVGNLWVMHLLVDGAGLHYFAANLVATAAAGIADFMLSEFAVFAVPREGPAASDCHACH